MDKRHKGYRETDTHVFFYGSVFSNWFPCEFYVDHVKYNSSEQYFIGRKAAVMGDFETLGKIMSTDNPAEQKAFGKQVKNFDQKLWDAVKSNVMITGLIAKFLDNTDLLEQLLDTGKKIMVEASPYDKIWGIGLAIDDDRILDPKNWQGQNLLGLALNHVKYKCEVRIG